MTVLCPKGKTEIYPIITTHFPFQNRPARELIWCYHHCLEIAEFMPSIRPQVLRFIIDGCLKMDVDIKVHLGGVVKLDKKELSDFGGAFNWEDLESSMQSSRQPKDGKEATSVYELIDKVRYSVCYRWID
jgi:RNA polymerase I specific transcription initiation factor RRN3